MKPFFYLSLSAIILSSSLLAYTSDDGCRPTADNYYNDSQRGWFFNEPTCVKKDKNVTKQMVESSEKKKYKLIPKVVEIPWDIIDQIDPEQIAQMERDAQKTALMYPTNNNVKQHRLLQEYVVKKSVAYAEAGDMLGRSDTDLAKWRSEKPTSAFKKDVTTRDNHEKGNEILHEYSQKAGLVVITQPGCPYCKRQIPILNNLKDETDFSYKEVDMSRAPAIVQKLGVARTPDIFLVMNVNGQAKWQRVASGLNTLDELRQAILMGLYQMGEIKDENLVYQQ